jgi:hypothetical protein
VIAIVASIMRIRVFRYVDGRYGNSEGAAIAKELSEELTTKGAGLVHLSGGRQGRH